VGAAVAAVALIIACVVFVPKIKRVLKIGVLGPDFENDADLEKSFADEPKSKPGLRVVNGAGSSSMKYKQPEERQSKRKKKTQWESHLRLTAIEVNKRITHIEG
jgi:hypothetical protein